MNSYSTWTATSATCRAYEAATAKCAQVFNTRPVEEIKARITELKDEEFMATAKWDHARRIKATTEREALELIITGPAPLATTDQVTEIVRLQQRRLIAMDDLLMDIGPAITADKIANMTRKTASQYITRLKRSY